MRWALAGCALAALAAVVVSRHTPTESVAAPLPVASGSTGIDVDSLPVIRATAPPVDAAAWINTTPLSASDFEGKVVLYDFWTFGCVNCKHTLPHVQAWQERYAADGLVIVGIHSPEFGYERDPANVAAFVRDNDLTFPVALDPDWTVWKAWGNRFWPHFLLFDADGRQRYDHAGEGGYEQTEDVIRGLLGVAADSPRADIAP
jgi:thiol-disulfide isomerase/thioredoxin